MNEEERPSHTQGEADPSAAAVPYVKPLWVEVRSWIRAHFTDNAPGFTEAFMLTWPTAMVLFIRRPDTNFIFDEQEALLANPYVRSVADSTSKLHWLDAFRRDFWGLLPDRSIGSYRPLPNLVWRFLWMIGARLPVLDAYVNVILHAVNGAFIVVLAYRLTRDRHTAWLAGFAFTAAAIATEAVSGVVGLADVLGALGAILALLALFLPLWAMPWAVLLATLAGLYAKESALCIVPLVPFFALFLSQRTHPERPLRLVRAFVALLATSAALVFYVEARRRAFPTTMPAELSVAAHASGSRADRAFAAILRWYAQPALPKDPLNNPLVDAKTMALRTGGALRVFFRGLVQVFFPSTLSGDYSAPQETVPLHPWFPESVLGAAGMILPWIAAPALALASFLQWLRKSPVARRTEIDDRPLVAACLVWVVVSYFPVSNIPILLPTVRAERFWYFPLIGLSILLGLTFSRLFAWSRAHGAHRYAVFFVAAYFAFQAVAARRHANDYDNDLTFWDATRRSVPRSAKAHLNYSVMKGARGDLEERRRANEVALSLAPQWPMANVYLGDTLCRLHRPRDAWPHYKAGFDLAPNDSNLISLALQCLWDEHALSDPEIASALAVAGSQHPGSWLDYLQRDTIDNGAAHNGVDPKYRPRGYNEGPKSE